MYPSVPSFVLNIPVPSCPLSRQEKPKSASLRMKFEVSSKFYGFISRWAYPLSCMKWSPFIIWWKYVLATFSENLPVSAIKSKSSPPPAYSNTIAKQLCYCPFAFLLIAFSFTAISLMRFSWLRSFITFSSSLSVSRVEVSCLYCFTATYLPSESIASFTLTIMRFTMRNSRLLGPWLLDIRLYIHNFPYDHFPSHEIIMEHSQEST
mgnify:CR=1 FL=1